MLRAQFVGLASKVSPLEMGGLAAGGAREVKARRLIERGIVDALTFNNPSSDDVNYIKGYREGSIYCGPLKDRKNRVIVSQFFQYR